jgi:energy-converting hydrogenase Eha subunit G
MDTVVFGALIWQVVDFLRELANFRTQKSSAITQAAAWIAGVLVVVLAAHADVASALILPGTDQALGNLDFGSQVLVGLLVSSFASTGVDFKQAFDRSDSAVKPPLIGAGGAAPPAA